LAGAVNPTFPPSTSSIGIGGRLTPPPLPHHRTFLPQFIDTDAPSKVLAFLMLGLVFDFNGTLWNILVAWLSARVANTVRNMGQLHRWIDRALGTLFIYIGIRLAVGERG
jgi:threonine/homoserine/homoserine lactone efflux protein